MFRVILISMKKLNANKFIDKLFKFADLGTSLHLISLVESNPSMFNSIKISP